MKNDFKYLTTSSEDTSWGIYMNAAGSLQVDPKSEYPSQDHPSSYYYQWDEGRILNEFQINYITEGMGIYENRYGSFPVKQGDIMIVHPGEWHRYRPNASSGWIENYVGFDGKIARMLMDHVLFRPEAPIISSGIHAEIIDTYLKIFDLALDERPGYQQVVSGMIVKLLGYIISLNKGKSFDDKAIVKVIEQARFYMRNNLDKNIDFKELSAEYFVGYSTFRQMFKKYTGVSPGQYHLQIKIQRAKELLLHPDLSVKEVSNRLGFQSIYHFSSLFKKKAGMSPTDYRKTVRVS